eukprot:scaffold18931_cov62-Attheya_sp.AAC.6
MKLLITTFLPLKEWGNLIGMMMEDRGTPTKHSCKSVLVALKWGDIKSVALEWGDNDFLFLRSGGNQVWMKENKVASHDHIYNKLLLQMENQPYLFSILCFMVECYLECQPRIGQVTLITGNIT